MLGPYLKCSDYDETLRKKEYKFKAYDSGNNSGGSTSTWIGYGHLVDPWDKDHGKISFKLPSFGHLVVFGSFTIFFVISYASYEMN